MVFTTACCSPAHTHTRDHVPRTTLWWRVTSANRASVCKSEVMVAWQEAFDQKFVRTHVVWTLQSKQHRDGCWKIGSCFRICLCGSAPIRGMLGTTMCWRFISWSCFRCLFARASACDKHHFHLCSMLARVANNSITTNSNCFFFSSSRKHCVYQLFALQLSSRTASVMYMTYDKFTQSLNISEWKACAV